MAASAVYEEREHMTEPCKIFDDPRPIRAIWYDGEDAGGYSIDNQWDRTTSKIVAYRENGSMGHVPFYAVYDLEGNIKARVPAHIVTVVYDV